MHKATRWHDRPSAQQPHYADLDELACVIRKLESSDPLVSAGEIQRLRTKLAGVNQGKAFVLQAGNCAEVFGTQTPVLTNLIKIILQMTMILMYGAQMEIVKLVRGAGQFAKPRSSDTDTSGLPSYRGDMINGLEPTAEARRHDPLRLLEAHSESARIWTEIRHLTTGGFAELRRIHEWNLNFVARTRQGLLYEHTAQAIDQALGFMEACGVMVRGMQATRVAEMFTSHEALVLDYEAAMLRDGFATSGHFVWIGERTRALGGAHVEFFRHLRNPIGVKLGPKTTPQEVESLCAILNPRNLEGKLVFIPRMGAANVSRVLPDLMSAAAGIGCPVIWICDPMHGNTISADGNGLKTRRMKHIKAEISGFFKACAITGTRPGGVHLELTGDDVTECLGGHQDITADDLPRQYLTACDPRLNGWQSLEIAFYVAKLLREHRESRQAALVAA